MSDLCCSRLFRRLRVNDTAAKRFPFLVLSESAASVDTNKITAEL